MAGIDNNTILYLRGDSFEDLSLSPKTITNNGVTITESDIVNNCYKVDGKNNYVSFSDVSLPSDFTIECMVNLGSYANGFGFPIITSVNSPVAGQQFISIITSSISNYVAKRVTFSEHASTSPRLQSSVEIDLNTWYHIALVRKNKTINLYVNGVNQGSLSYASVFSITNAGFGCIIDNEYGINTKIYNYRISNVARYTEDFALPTKPYNSITINKTNQTDTNIEFNIEKLGQEVINKVEVLVNGTVSETYTDSYDNINYSIDTDLCSIGNNSITIRVAFDDTYAEEEVITYKYTVPPLPQETSLLDTVERVKLLTKSRQNEKTILSSILTSKNVEVSEEDKMSDLIGKVDLLGDAPPPPLYLYENGDECIDVTGGWGLDIKNGTASYELLENKIKVLANGNNSHIYVSTQNKIDLTNYRKIHIISDNITTGTTLFALHIKQSIGNYSSVSQVHDNSNFLNTQHTLDISNLNGLYYVSVLYGNDTKTSLSVTGNIYKIWLEK